MNLRTEFTEIECRKFRDECNFTPDERRIFDLRVKDHSIIEICSTLHMTESTVNRRIRNIKNKILKVI